MLRFRQRPWFICGLLVGIMFSAQRSQGQYTDDFQTNIISGVVSNWSGDYVVGGGLSYDSLFIQSGGVLSNGNGSVGYTNGNYNAVVVSDIGSVWNNNGTLVVGFGIDYNNHADYNSLTVAKGGVVYSAAAVVGYHSAGNAVLVTDSGSVWYSGSLALSPNFPGGDNSLTISNGGVVYSSGASVGLGGTASVLVTGSGSIWYSGGLAIGDSATGPVSLTIANGGAVYSSYGSVGAWYSPSKALVTGTGSVWHMTGALTVGETEEGDSVTIANGGVVYSSGGVITAYGSSVSVGGPGSAWYNSGDLKIGYGQGFVDYLTITNGGVVYNVNASFGYSVHDVVSVSGPGSVWNNSGDLSIGTTFNGGGGTLSITDGGCVLASNVYVGRASIEIPVSQVTISGGALYVTNALGNGVLDIEVGTFLLNGGTVTVDSLVVTNGSPYSHNNPSYASMFTFTGGTLNTKATSVYNGSVFTVGDGTNAAALTLASGGSGFHSFANGLTISSNAMLNGNGTVIGAVTVNSGGLLSPGNSPGSITFSNSLTLAVNSTFAVQLNGTAVGQYDQIVALDTVSVSNCVLSVSLGFTPSVGDSFTIISNLGPSAVLGMFVDTEGHALTDGAEFQVDETTFEIEYAANANGLDVVLTDVVPEPATWLLVALGVGGVIGLRRRWHGSRTASSS